MTKKISVYAHQELCQLAQERANKNIPSSMVIGWEIGTSSTGETLLIVTYRDPATGRIESDSVILPPPEIV